MRWINFKHCPPDSLPHPLDQYIRVSQLDSFKYINSGFLEAVPQVKSDFQDIQGTLVTRIPLYRPKLLATSLWKIVPL